MDTQTQINQINSRLDMFATSSGLSRDAETAIRERIGNPSLIVSQQYNTATFTATSSMFIAPFPCKIVAVLENHYIAGTDGSAVTMQMEVLKSGQAFGAGTFILSTAFNLKSTAKTTNVGALTSGGVVMGVGDRIAPNVSGVLTGLEGVTVTLHIQKL